jgi:putative hydrolase of the HAD superfamily
MANVLRGVFFDIDDTLYSTREFAARARRNACRAMHERGLNLPVEQIYEELREVIAEFSSNHNQHFDKLLLRLPRRAFEGVNPAILVAAAVSAYHDTKRELKPDPAAAELLRRLAATDLVVGVITAGLPVKQAEKLLRLGLYEYFTPSAIFISDQIGISKPNPKLFARACEECGLEPAECLYVGNDPAQDIAPALAAGMAAALVGDTAGRDAGTPAPTILVASLAELGPAIESTFSITLPP